MSQVLTLELSDEMYTFLKQQAEVAGVSISEWIATSLEQHSGLQKKQQNEAEKEAARQRFRQHAGSIDLGYPTGVDNESIDSEAEVIRSCIDLHLSGITASQIDLAAWEAEKEFIEQIKTRPVKLGGRDWQREDLYER